MKNRNTRILSAFAVAAAAAIAFAAAAAVDAQTSTGTSTTTTTTVTTSAPAVVYTQMYTSGTMPNGGIPNLLNFSDETLGSSGPQVYDVQAFLAEAGFFNIGLPTGYFGSVTQAALKSYQSSIGLPSTGYFGSLSRAAMETTYTVAAQKQSAMAAAAAAANAALGNTTATVTSTTVSNATTGMSASNNQPLSPTGYWYNGNWYASVPAAGMANISGYWINGVWTPVQNTSTSNTASNATISNVNSTGYWYNGVWYPATTSTTYTTSSSGDSQGVSTSHNNPSANANPTGTMTCSYQTMSDGSSALVCH